MDASARRVYAERARRRLPPRLRRRRWGTRIAGLIGTAGLAGVAVAIALMVAPSHHAGDTALATTPPRPHEAKPHKAKPKKPPGPTKTQLAQRRAAVAQVRLDGYTPVSLSDYDFKTRLHVLIGKRTSDGARLAFFFVLTHYIGHDSTTPSTSVRVVKNRLRSVTLAYRTFRATDASCCPQGPRVKVTFTWNGTQLVPEGTIPAPFARLRSG